MNDALTDALNGVKGYREEIVKLASAKGWSTDMPPITHFYRDDRLVAIIMARTVNRDLGLKWTYFGVAGFSADAVLQVQDTWVTTDPKLLGGDVPEGELERLVNAGKREEHQISECLVGIWTEAGDKESAGVQLPYEIVGDTVVWGELREMQGVTGRLSSAAVRGFAEPNGKTKLAELQATPEWATIYDGEPGDEMLHTDLGFVRTIFYLDSSAVDVGYIGKDDHENEIVTASYEHMAEQLQTGEAANMILGAIVQYMAQRENPN